MRATGRVSTAQKAVPENLRAIGYLVVGAHPAIEAITVSINISFSLFLVRVVTTLVATHEKPLSQSIYSQIAVIASIARCAPPTRYPIARKFSGTAFCAVDTWPVARILIHILSSLNSFVRNN